MPMQTYLEATIYLRGGAVLKVDVTKWERFGNRFSWSNANFPGCRQLDSLSYDEVVAVAHREKRTPR